jgi:hypothetical protein
VYFPYICRLSIIRREPYHNYRFPGRNYQKDSDLIKNRYRRITMALSLDSKIKDIMRSPEGKAVMEKWAPGSTKDPRMKLVGALTYRKLLSYPESAEVAVHADEIDADLKACSR